MEKRLVSGIAFFKDPVVMRVNSVSVYVEAIEIKTERHDGKYTKAEALVHYSVVREGGLNSHKVPIAEAIAIRRLGTVGYVSCEETVRRRQSIIKR